MRKQETQRGKLEARREERRKELESLGTWNEEAKNLRNWNEIT